jgi:hypothetical protein
MATRPVVPGPESSSSSGQDSAPAAAVHHAGLRHVPDGLVLWADRGDGNGNLTYTGGQLLPDWVLAALDAGAAMVPGPTGVLVLGPVPKTGKPAGRHVPGKDTA